VPAPITTRASLRKARSPSCPSPKPKAQSKGGARASDQRQPRPLSATSHSAAQSPPPPPPGALYPTPWGAPGARARVVVRYMSALASTLLVLPALPVGSWQLAAGVSGPRPRPRPSGQRRTARARGRAGAKGRQGASARRGWLLRAPPRVLPPRKLLALRVLVSLANAMPTKRLKTTSYRTYQEFCTHHAGRWALGPFPLPVRRSQVPSNCGSPGGARAAPRWMPARLPSDPLGCCRWNGASVSQ
jgi:hypothetical protein